MNKADNNEPPIIAKFGSVIVDYDGAQLIKKTCIYIIFNCLICLFGVVILVVDGAIANVIVPVIFVYFGIKKADELIKGQMKDIIYNSSDNLVCNTYFRQHFRNFLNYSCIQHSFRYR